MIKKVKFPFGKSSTKKILTTHPDIQKIMYFASMVMNLTVIEGVRSNARQAILFKKKKSKTMLSKHLKQPDGWSHAIDTAPYNPKVKGGIDWKDREGFIAMQFLIKGIATALYEIGEISHLVRSGIDWDNDNNIKEHSFFDGPHSEIYKP